MRPDRPTTAPEVAELADGYRADPAATPEVLRALRAGARKGDIEEAAVAAAERGDGRGVRLMRLLGRLSERQRNRVRNRLTLSGVAS